MKTLVMLLAFALTASAAAAEMYTWKDSKGTTFYTNSLHEIPARYLKRARVLDVATGKKGGPALASPGTPTAPTAPGGAASSPPQAPQLVQSAQVPQPQPIAPAAAPIAAPAPAAAVAPVPAAPSRSVSAERQQRSAGGDQRALRRHRRTLEE
ncbi:protein of unknown function, DUF4124-containing [Citrifermentans bemidjiense Bem]|uniref:DUF4124 domain-containing protein n=1 Tax=Citrifermentans bemidjiense (strain ATCC BAA-1014 / DSM 16622 / JCM 12645 / Bem) TaxID=404380 RepID=B5E9Z5_CITBB|nr:DUF4124 domain-containing protein [Citrifermentans bemidjiense]ACH37293.1 protein of unknown function, DUF4124-containing [Citrifermentans bemidjiense Bem]